MKTKDNKSNQLHYLTISERDEDWGLVVSTIGNQLVAPQSTYPPRNHPANYLFSPQNGRILNEFQLIYITQGQGFFSSQSSKHQKVEAGTMILLFPHEWHSYYPDPNTGWEEYWVGFKGKIAQHCIEKGFFSIANPLLYIGLSSTVSNLYHDILCYASKEKTGFQQIISSIVFHLLSTVYYRARNHTFANNTIIEKINEARTLMKEHTENPIAILEIAERIGVGYTWFRRMFKDYTGISPAQYQMQLRLMRAKELLTTTDLNVVEIAYRLNFGNGGQFATFFKNKEQISPSDFRKRMH
ncbi:MAG: AraC family transcriptional regulator [Massilibacteroides sp.]|nr:AraC family transcriptional regulator [Massilibacteroides sp.]